jgi:heme-degrading monooxygenase HmoA
MSVLLTVSIRAFQGCGGDLVELLGTASPEEEIDGCFGISVFQNINDPDEVLIIERWDQVERHKQFLASLEDAGALKPMQEMSESVTRQYFTEIDK